MDIKKDVYYLGDMAVVYTAYKDIPAFTIVPKDMVDKIDDEKIVHHLYKEFGHCIPMPMVDVVLQGDNCSQNFSAGDFMHTCSTALQLRYKDRVVEQIGENKRITTYLSDNLKINAEHIVEWNENEQHIVVFIKVTNISNENIVIEGLPSFQICGLTPFNKDNDTENIIISELQNNWSSEARLHQMTASELSFYDSWSHFGMRGYRIGQKGSMSARGHLPFIAIEDKNEGVTWIAKIEAGSSWEMEVIHNNSAISLSGGQADYNFGHWRKVLSGNESYSTEKSYLTCAKGDLLSVSQRMLEGKKANLVKTEESYPIIFNEYLVSWGNPSIELEKNLIEEALKYNVNYFVMDSGWYKEPNVSWNEIGDWNVSKVTFPNGLKEYSDFVRQKGMIPGIWFEFECASKTSQLFKDHPDWMLTKDGIIIENGGRVFLDFRKDEVKDYLKKKVIQQLVDSNIGYVKIDYNDNIGLGVDGADSYAEGLRNHIEAVRSFYCLLKTEIPELIVEVCSSGGMRHTPYWLSLGDMCSFSDSHFYDEGVAIAMGLHRYMVPSFMQIWAWVKSEQDERQMMFTLSKGMLGRLCISGNLHDLSEKQLKILQESVDFYNSAKDTISNGKTDFIQDDVADLNKLEGKTLALSKATDTDRLVYVFFNGKTANNFEFILNDNYYVDKSFGNVKFELKDKKLLVIAPKESHGSLIVNLKKGD